MKNYNSKISEEDWDELEETINREKQIYTKSDLIAAAERMKERCIEACEKIIEKAGKIIEKATGLTWAEVKERIDGN
jgi:hypothetical protein